MVWIYRNSSICRKSISTIRRFARTTKELYGECLHKYTIQNAIHDNAVLGFQVEHNGPKNIVDETDSTMYDNETHMLKVLDIILNKLYMSFSLSFHIFSNVRIAPFYQLFGHFAFVVNLTYQGLTSYIFPIKRG